MTVRLMYALVTAQGEYLHIGATQAHIGTKEHISIVDSAERASLYSHPALDYFRMRDLKAQLDREYPGTKFVPVRETRTVDLMGFGVETSFKA